MNNKVVHTLARAFNELGIKALRFNYRGVGASHGVYDEGNGETLDALAVLDWANDCWPGVPLYLAGFSFGGAVAIRAARQRRIERLVTVAPAIERISAEPALPECPWLLIQGSADELLDPAATQRWVVSLPRPPQLVMLEGVSHFFHGHLTQLKDVVLQWLQG
jgi:alpha/beta superfamily hydrolase